jgi:hypothetical protein
MTFITYLVLITAMTPAPTYMLAGQYKSVDSCLAAKAALVEKNKIPKDKAQRLQCMTVVTSRLTDT